MMTIQEHRQRFFMGVGAVLIILCVGFGIANRLIPTWGSTPVEQTQALPGDDYFTHPILAWNHAMTIDASPEEVWPWIAQMGDTRGGYYSYRFIEKAITATAGVDVSGYYNNTNQVRPEWQSPSIGQPMLMEILVLRDYKAGQYLVAGPKPGADDAGLLWTWAITPTSDGRTRLLVHMRIQIPGVETNKAIGAALNLSTFMMERKMMDGIRLRSEGGAEADWVQVFEALVWFVVLGVGIGAARRFTTLTDWRLSITIGLACVVFLLVLVYLQPPLLMRSIAVLLLAGALIWDIQRDHKANHILSEELKDIQ
jgi:hypothetical protein